jgi:hypothetical protein
MGNNIKMDLKNQYRVKQSQLEQGLVYTERRMKLDW